MEFVLVSVICSVLVSVLLKWARLKAWDTRQMILWNYPVAVLLTYIFFPPQWEGLWTLQSPWFLYAGMALLLPGLFMILSLSLRYSGLVITEVAQRISLVLPLLAAFLWFQENLKTSSLVGIGLGLLAIVLCLGWHKQSVEQSKINMKYPLLVFLGYGIVDILFKKIAQLTVVPYTSSMLLIFAGAFVVSLSYVLYLLLVKKAVFSIRSLGMGLVLGVFNFFNILFYMKAHQALPDQPSVVFTGMNIGVIALGVLAGRYIFDEKPSKLNYLGVFLAVVAVLFIAFTL